ncbi:hypothetical protein J1605_017271 [Eschrichtius robustus]|uniref:G-protein-signaling modulator 1 n=1 Tax=Eschrichtius robustus TaxID=9764 RepID=A0AB34I4P2_ESCRO|nr:hypothetical protein J1605_017271 [Eschrichtius robustus]
MGTPALCTQGLSGRLLGGCGFGDAPPQPQCHPQVGEARALYNIGNVYHAKGKQLSWNAAQDPGHLPPAVRETLRRASEFYELHLKTRVGGGREADPSLGAQTVQSRPHLGARPGEGLCAGHRSASSGLGGWVAGRDTAQTDSAPRRNLSLVKELGDRAAQGRAYGNLGNTHYLLGSFTEATTFHKEPPRFVWAWCRGSRGCPSGRTDIRLAVLGSGAGGSTCHLHRVLGCSVTTWASCPCPQRLAIAKEFGDKAAERRAYSNLGNAHIFLGRFDVAAEYYKKTLQLSRQLKDQAVEAQACYSLGNTYTLLQDYERAAEYHLRHLLIAQELADRVGEGRACWSLGNAYVSMGSPAQALTFAKKHLEISQEIGDRSGELTARMNVAQLQLALGRLSSPAAAEKPDLAGYEAQGQCLPFRPGFSEGGQLRPEPLARLALRGHPLGTPAAGGGRAEPDVWKGSRGGVAQPRVLLVFSSSFELRQGGHRVGVGTRQHLSSPRRLFCSALGPDPSQPGPQEASSHQAAGAGPPADAGKRPSSREDGGRDGLPRPVEAGLGAPALGRSCWRWASALSLGGPGEGPCSEETPGRGVLGPEQQESLDTTSSHLGRLGCSWSDV